MIHADDKKIPKIKKIPPIIPKKFPLLLINNC